MAKFAVLFFAALAFQAAFAGIWRRNGLDAMLDESDMGLQDVQTLGETGMGLPSLSGIWSRNWDEGMWGQSSLQGQGFGLGLGGLRADLMAQSPRQLWIQTRLVVGHLLSIVQSTGLNGQEARQIIAMKLSQVIDITIGQLQEVMTIGNGSADIALLRQVMLRLREVEQILKRIVMSDATTSTQIKMELANCIQIAATQMEKLVVVVQGVAQDRISVVIKNILGEFLVGTQQILRKIQNVSMGTDISGAWGRQSGMQLMQQMKMLANMVAQDLQTVGINGQQLKQVVIMEARQLVQVIDNIIDRLQAERTMTDVQQVMHILRQMQMELQQIASAGMLTTGHQIRSQLASIIETIALELNKLCMVVQADMSMQGGMTMMPMMAKSALVQYVIYLRNLQMQLQGNTLGLGLLNNAWDVPMGYSRLGQNQALWGLQGESPAMWESGLENIWCLQGACQGISGRQLEVQGLGGRQLVNQIQIHASRVAQKLQTMSINNGQTKQIIIVQARQLIQIIDNIIDRLESELTITNAHQIIRMLRQTQMELQQILSTGVLTTVHQFVRIIETMARQVSMLSEVQMQGGIKNVLAQYLIFLRNLEIQLQGSSLGLGVGSAWSYDLPMVHGALGTVRGSAWGSRGMVDTLGGELDESMDVLPMGVLGGDLDNMWINRKVIRGL